MSCRILVQLLILIVSGWVNRRQQFRHEDANQSYIEEGILLLELASDAHSMFEEQPPEQRRRLLNGQVSRRRRAKTASLLRGPVRTGVKSFGAEVRVESTRDGGGAAVR